MADATAIVQPAATKVRDPVTGRSIWLVGLVKNERFVGDELHLTIAFGAEHTEAARSGIEDQLRAALRDQGFTGVLVVEKGGEKAAPPGSSPGRPVRGRPPVPGMEVSGVQPHGGPIQKKPVDGVRHIVAVASGKGGVGKSTVATNLAVALARRGVGVGLLDLDVYGPSVPTMMSVSSRPMVDAEKKIVPVTSYGVRCMSMGLLVPEEEAMIWRGPMIMGVLRQFLQDVRWTGSDYLVVDLPPGTGDAQLSLIQAVDIAGAIVVTTPQKVALADCVRGITMFKKLGVPLIGVVENMAWYQLPDGSRDYVFGRDGGTQTAARHGTEIVAQIPLQTSLRKSCDQGLPAALGDDAIAAAFADLAGAVMRRLPLEAL